MTTHADVMTQLDTVMLDLRIHLTYFSTIMLMLAIALTLWSLKPLMEYAQKWQWWLPFTVLLPLLLVPPFVGIVLIATLGDNRLLAAAPGIMLNIGMVTVLLAVLGGGLWQALYQYGRGYRF